MGKREQVLRDSFRTVLLLAIAYVVSSFLLHGGGETACALVHVLALVLICRITYGYLYGVAAAVASTFSINYFFMYPYTAFNFVLTGYPLTMAITLTVSVVVSALASRAKRGEIQAIKREQQTRILYEQNLVLEAERTAVQVAAAQEKLRSNLLRAVSHDLRTPLTGISGVCTVLLENEVTPERQRELLTGVQENAEWLTRVVENLLAVTKAEGQAAAIHKTEEAAEEVAAQALQKLRSRFPDIRIQMQLPPDVLLVPMDPLLIEQVLLNLLENAVRHSGAPESIVLRIQPAPQGTEFQVSDQGCGVPEATLAYLQKDAWQGLAGDSKQGTGIGLSVCQSIIAAHDGQFYVKNRPEGGAEAGFILPAAPDHLGRGKI